MFNRLKFDKSSLVALHLSNFIKWLSVFVISSFKNKSNWCFKLVNSQIFKIILRLFTSNVAVADTKLQVLQIIVNMKK